MTRVLMALSIVLMMLQPLPVSARRASHNEGFAPRSSPPTLRDPCKLSPRLAQIHARIYELNESLIDGEYTVRRLHHTTRWPGYKHIERIWPKLTAETLPALATLSDFPLAFDFTPDSPEKKAALTLIAAYQNALEHILKHGNAIMYYERTEVTLSVYFWRRQYLSFGVESDPFRAGRNDAARYLLDQSPTGTVDITAPKPTQRQTTAPWYSPSGGFLDALLGVKIAEHHYGALCHAPAFHPLRTAMDSSR